TWSGVKATKSTTTSKLRLASTARTDSGSRMSACRISAPSGTARNELVPRLRTVSAIPLANALAAQAALIVPVPPMKSTRRDVMAVNVPVPEGPGPTGDQGRSIGAFAQAAVRRCRAGRAPAMLARRPVEGRGEDRLQVRQAAGSVKPPPGVVPGRSPRSLLVDRRLVRLDQVRRQEPLEVVVRHVDGRPEAAHRIPEVPQGQREADLLVAREERDDGVLGVVGDEVVGAHLTNAYHLLSAQVSTRTELGEQALELPRSFGCAHPVGEEV